jgi:hypothetical protein
VWRNPKHYPPAERPQAEQRPEPPVDRGERLATFARGDGVEMRVSRAEYQGRPFVSLRVWERDQAGAWWPVKGKGCSVRMNEVGELAEALQRVATPSPPARTEPKRRDSWTPLARESPPPAEGFNEFEG